MAQIQHIASFFTWQSSNLIGGVMTPPYINFRLSFFKLQFIALRVNKTPAGGGGMLVWGHFLYTMAPMAMTTAKTIRYHRQLMPWLKMQATTIKTLPHRARAGRMNRLRVF